MNQPQELGFGPEHAPNPPAAAGKKTTCPVRECSTSIASHMAVCGKHWRLVPTSLAQAVMDAYRRGQFDPKTGEYSSGWRQAVKDCVTSIHAQLGEQRPPPATPSQTQNPHGPPGHVAGVIKAAGFDLQRGEKGVWTLRAEGVYAKYHPASGRMWAWGQGWQVKNLDATLKRLKAGELRPKQRDGRYRSGTCRSCEGAIIWYQPEGGKAQPLNLDGGPHDPNRCRAVA